jgi:uncharacterized protein (DUF736 family)
MSAKEYDNEMRFVLFPNDKGDNDKRPNLRGSIQIAGVEYDLSAWTKVSAKGTKFLSGQVQPKRDSAKPATQAEPENKSPISDDDVPF